MSRNQRRTIRFSFLAFALGLTSLLVSDQAVGKGTVSLMQSLKLPASTIAVLDPEGGSSSGTAGAEINLAAGDYLTFNFDFTLYSDGVAHGVNHYVTAYIPDNLEVVGVRLLNDNGDVVLPHLPGLGYDGCGSQSYCNADSGTSGDLTVWCDNPASDECTEQGGSIAQLYGDTGFFYAPNTLGVIDETDRQPFDELLQLTDGIAAYLLEISGGEVEPKAIHPTFNTGLGISQDWYAHNDWDFWQVRAFGNQDTDTLIDQGNTPFGYGSPVAGQHSGYQYEAVEGDGGNPHWVWLNGDQGPWSRIQYPGSTTPESLVANRGAGNGLIRDAGDASTTGWDLYPDNALAAGTTLRVATGQLIRGRKVTLAVSARVTDVFGVDPGTYPENLFIDPIHEENVVCGEIFGGAADDDNPWPYYAADPSCVSLRAIVDVTANNPLTDASSGDISFDIKIKNLAVVTDKTVIVRVQNTQSSDMDSNGVGTTTWPGTKTVEANCGAMDATKSCVKLELSDLAPGDEFNWTVYTDSGGAGQETQVLKVNYQSSGNATSDPVLKALAFPGFTSQDLTQSRQFGVPRTDLTWNETSVTSGNAATFTGTLHNDGFDPLSYDALTLHLPTGWTITNTTTGVVNVGGTNYTCSADCTTETPSFTLGSGVALLAKDDLAYATKSVAFSVDTAGSQDNYPIDLEWDFDPGLGNGQLYEREKVWVSIDAVRSDTPTLQCPIISSGDMMIRGYSDEDGATVRIYFDGIEHEVTGTVSGGEFAVDVSAYGALYGGLDIRATVEGTGENESERSDACEGGVQNTRQCSDGFDNDGDGRTDFPADYGCASPSDNSEGNESDGTDDIPNNECSNADPDNRANPGQPGVPGDPDDDDDTFTDFGSDPDCVGPDDDVELADSPNHVCNDGVDNDLDGYTDGADPSCARNLTAGFHSERDYALCQNLYDDDSDGEPAEPASEQPGIKDFANGLLDAEDGNGEGDDNGCHSAFDDQEETEVPVPGIIKPRILFVFDTSGSMNSHPCALPGEDALPTDFTGGDGSTECPGQDIPDGLCLDPIGNTAADDSRLYKVKEGISDVIASYGEVEYGLMRFKQRPQAFGCPGTADNFGSGGWIGGGVEGGTQCNPFNEGELLVSFSPDNVQTLLKWMDHDSNYGELHGPEQPGLDQTTAPYGLDWELRGTGSTPLEGALQSAETYLNDVKTADPDGDCRPYRIILVTDGLESCDGDPETRAGTIYSGGIPVSVIGFASDDPGGPLETGLNLIARAGSGNQDDAIIVSDEATLSNAVANIVAESILVEYCNGLDDDCDGKIDEDYGLWDDVAQGPPRDLACSNDKDGICLEEGFLRCASVDVYDNRDVTCCKDPEGLILANDGGTTHTVPRTGAVEDYDDRYGCTQPVGDPTPGTEICNYKDDNCDGLIDNGIVCSCSAEICDGLDNDCDDPTEIDEEADCIDCPRTDKVCDPDDPPNHAPELCCGSDVGVCKPGTWICDGSNGVVCDYTNGVEPGLEDDVNLHCDGLDNDCDGIVDEPTEECFTGDPLICPDGEPCEGECQRGDIVCLPGPGYGPSTCLGEVLPTAEICDGLDNDCDGEIDEGLVAGDPSALPGDACTIITDTGDPGDAFDPGANCTATGVYACVYPGSIICNANPIVPINEYCDGSDNDCDGIVDEAWGACSHDGSLPCTFGAGGDAYCDGLSSGATCVDNAFAPGACSHDGYTPCNVGAAGDTFCNGESSGATCVDNSDSWLPWPAAACGGSGTCGAGVFRCIGGAVQCDGNEEGEPEICDGLDNDCDAETDESFPEDGVICYPGTYDGGTGIHSDGRYYDPADPDAPPGAEFIIYDGTVCNPGATECVGGELFCADYVGPSDEVCNGLDDDCDGETDEMAECPGDSICLEGACVSPCNPGEFPCGFGFYCAVVQGQSENFCLPDPCVDINCESGFFCESETGTCVDLCADVQCIEGAFCQEGFCLDCNTIPCPEGELCIAQGTGVSVCEDDPCFGVVCDEDAGELCVDGTCRAADCGGACGSNERCVEGECVADGCAGVNCPRNTVCVPSTGECEPETLCDDVQCFNGEACDSATGDCVPDECAGITCPQGLECRTFDGNFECVQPDGDRVYAGGNGCAVGGDRAPAPKGLALIGLVLLGLVRMRRRRR